MQPGKRFSMSASGPSSVTSEYAARLHIFTAAERLTLYILHTMFNLTSAQRHDIFGRIHENEWLGRGYVPYTAEQLDEVWNGRWVQGQARAWTETCHPPIERLPKAIAPRQRQLDKIEQAAKRDGDGNLFTGTINRPIELVQRTLPYVDAAPPAGNASGSARMMPNVPSLFSATTREDSSAVGSSSAPGSTAPATSRPAAKSCPVAESSSAAGDSASQGENAPEVGSSCQPASEANAPATASSAAGDEPLHDKRPQLQMVHSCLVDETVFPPYYSEDLIHRFIDKSSRLYRYGGFAQRVRDDSENWFDVMLCAKDLCGFCRYFADDYHSLNATARQDIATEAANELIIDPEKSPFKGKPHVHQARDAVDAQLPGYPNRYIFKPESLGDGDTPARFAGASKVLFDDQRNRADSSDGCRGWRWASFCDLNACIVCQASMGPPPNVDLESFDEDLYSGS